MNARKKKKLIYISEYDIHECYEPAEGGYVVEESIFVRAIRVARDYARKIMKREFGTDKEYYEYEDGSGYVILEDKCGCNERVYRGYE